MASTSWAEAAMDTIAIGGWPDKLAGRARDLDGIGGEQRIDRSVSSDALTVMAPADSGIQGFCGESVADLPTKTTASSFGHQDNLRQRGTPLQSGATGVTDSGPLGTARNLQ
jgi:hypothetical protein